MHYLPEISEGTLQDRLFNPDSDFLADIEKQNYERLGLDRALLIAADILIRQGRINRFSILDVGCNSGLIGRVLGMLGNSIVAIDSGVVDVQERYETLSGIQKVDLFDYLISNQAHWDFVLLLSVAHHWESGYAMSGKGIYSEARIHEIFATLKQRTDGGIYLELPLKEPGFSPDFSDEFVKKYCRDFQIVEINRTIGTNGFLRRLFYLDNSGVNRNPLLEKILRNAHLYEKLENCRLSVPRAQYYKLEAAVQHMRRNGEVE